MAPKQDPHSRSPFGKWLAEERAEVYASTRFRARRSAERDPRLVLGLLDRFAPGGRVASLLDLPCGTGRLQAALESRCEHYVGADYSAAMLSRAGAAGLVQASARALPFEAGRFEAVVCCRLLHHLSGEELAAIVRELVRVSSGLVLASFWDAASLHAWRRRVGLRPDSSGRAAIAKSALEACFKHAGARPLGYAHSFRHVSQQAFIAALKVRG